MGVLLVSAELLLCGTCGLAWPRARHPPVAPHPLAAATGCRFLLGRHKAAVEVYSEAGRQIGGEDDWELHHNKGMCYVYLKQHAAAEEAFQTANAISRHDATYLQLGKLYAQRGDIKTALETYLEALEYSPDNPELLTTVGLLYMRLGQNFKAFEYLGNSLTHDPRSPKTILAVGSIIQDNGDMDVALVKYRVAAVQTPNSAQLWNNIGMCFFGKQKYVAAIACLKRALYLDPFEWIVSYNLGLVHLATEQYASAVHHLSASVSLKPDYGPAYAHLGTALAQLHDTANACSAFEKVRHGARVPARWAHSATAAYAPHSVCTSRSCRH